MKEPVHILKEAIEGVNPLTLRCEGGLTWPIKKMSSKVNVSGFHPDQTYVDFTRERVSRKFYLDDIISPSKTESYNFVDVIVTPGILSSMSEPDILEVLKRHRSYSKHSIHQIDKKKCIVPLSFWTGLKNSSVLEDDHRIVVILKH